MNFKMCLAFAALAFLVCLFSVYNQSLDDKRTTILEENIASNYMWAFTEASEALEDFGVTEYDLLRYNVATLTARMQHVYGTSQSSDCTTKNVVLSFDGQQKSKLPEIEAMKIQLFANDFENNGDGNPFFSPHDEEEFVYRFGSNARAYWGSFPQNGGEVMVAAKFLANFGIESREDAIGKHIVITIDTDTVPLVDATVCGVLTDEYYELSSRVENLLCPYVVTHVDNPIFQQNDVNLEARYMYHLHDWLDSSLESDLTEFVYETSVQYGAGAMLIRVEKLNQIMEVANALYFVIGAALIIGLVLTVYLMIDKYVKAFCRTSGVCATLGITRRDTYLLLALQILLIALLAIPLAIVMTTLGYMLITKLVLLVTNIELSATVAQIVVMLAVGIGVVLAVAAVFSLYVISKLHKRDIRSLLHTEVN